MACLSALKKDLKIERIRRILTPVQYVVCFTAQVLFSLLFFNICFIYLYLFPFIFLFYVQLQTEKEDTQTICFLHPH